ARKGPPGLLPLGEPGPTGRPRQAPLKGPPQRLPSGVSTCAARAVVMMLSFLLCARTRSRNHHAALVPQAKRDLIGVSLASPLEYADFIRQTSQEIRTGVYVSA